MNPSSTMPAPARPTRRWLRALAAVAGVGLLLAGLQACAEDPAPKRADAVTDSADTEPDTGGTDASTSDSTTASPGIWTQLSLPSSVQANLHAVWADSSTRVLAAGTGGTIVGWNGLGWQVHASGQFPTLHGIAASPKAGRAFAVGQSGTALLAKGEDGSAGTNWTPPDACTKPADCDDNNPCTLDNCASGSCQYAPSGAPGCCGGVAFADNFDKGLSRWTSLDSKTPPNGGISWSAASLWRPDGTQLATSTPRAAVFARTDVPCPGDASKLCATFDNGKTVGGTLTSEPFAIPAAQQATLAFALSLQVSQGFTDRFRVSIVTAGGIKSLLWDKETDLPAGSTGGKFVTITRDVAQWSGQTVQLELSFDSLTAQDNAGTGVAVDDLSVTTVCKPGVTSLKALTDQTIFGVWAFADDDAWAVGGKGFSAHWDGASWQQVSGGADPANLVSMSCAEADNSSDGPTGLAVGGPGVLQLKTSWLPGPTAEKAQWRSVHVANGPVQKDQPRAMAGDELGQVWRWEPDGWVLEDSSLGSPVLGMGVLADGTWIAASADDVAERKPDGSWSLVHSGGSWRGLSASGKFAILVGDGGALAERKGGIWQNLLLPTDTSQFETAAAVHVFGSGEAMAVGDNGVSWRRAATGTWTRQMTSTSVNLQGVWGASPDDMWAGGLSTNFVRWNGASWKNVKGPAGGSWYAMAGRSATEVYAAGEAGRMAKWDGVTWLELASGKVDVTLRAVWGASPTEVWAVGDGASIWRSQGGFWQRMPVVPYEAEDADPIEPNGTLLAIWGSGPQDVWAMGEPTSKGLGQVLHWNGASWRFLPLRFGDPRVVRAIWGWDGKRMLVAGTQGMVQRFDGSGFEDLLPGTVATLYGIAPFGKDALLVGDGATVLRYTPAW